MKTLIGVRILTVCVIVVLIIYLFNSTQNQNLKENSTDIRQFFTDGEQKKLVYNKHLQLFLDGHPSPAVGGKALFNHSLSYDQINRISHCRQYANVDWIKGAENFAKDKYVCINHHTYLKENNSILIEVGGNFGSDASLFTAVYNPRHLIVEPIPYYATLLQEKFKDNPRVTVLNFGLGQKTEMIAIELKGEASNIYSNDFSQTKINVSVINSTEFFQNLGVGIYSVDLLSMDCEGCELDVLENLLETGMVKYFKNIQLEIHSMAYFIDKEAYLTRYCTLQEHMRRTHRLTYQYKHVWENWRLLDLK